MFLIDLVKKKDLSSKSEKEFNSNEKIPYTLYKTGPFTEIPTEIKDSIEENCKKLKIENFEFFNDDMCIKFIKDNFKPHVLEAYNSLIPTAYKADIFRLCVLYINGGIYGDLTQTFLKNYDVNESGAHMILVKDRYVLNLSLNPIQISFMATVPNNEFFLYAINQICNQIALKDKGRTPTDVTGPRAVGRHFKSFFNESLKMGKHIYIGKNNKKYIIDTPFKQINSKFLSNQNKTINYVKLKIDNHYNLIYNNKERIKKKSTNTYTHQWPRNIVFK